MSDVLVADVAEDTTAQDEVGRDGAGVGVGDRGVPGHHLDGAQPGRGDPLPRDGDVARIEFDQPGGDVGPARVVGQDADQVESLARAQAHHADRTRCPFGERAPDVALDHLQSSGQLASGVTVGCVPVEPVDVGAKGRVWSGGGGHGQHRARDRVPGHGARHDE